MKFNPDTISQFIRDVAKEEVLPRWQHLQASDIAEKTGPDDVVTVADKAAEKALSARLKDAFPQSAIVGEEGAEADKSVMGLLQSDQPVWIIDPIDGTMAFSKGSPQFDIMLALVQKGELLAGWIYAPVDDDLYVGEKGAGVYRQLKQASKEKVQPFNTNPPLNALTGILGKKYFSDEQREDLKKHMNVFKGIINTICAGHDYARFARGEAQFAIYNKNMPWDHVPGLMMASELGFEYAKRDGSPYMPWDTTGGLLVTPKGMQEEIRRLLGIT